MFFHHLKIAVRNIIRFIGRTFKNRRPKSEEEYIDTRVDGIIKNFPQNTMYYAYNVLVQKQMNATNKNYYTQTLVLKNLEEEYKYQLNSTKKTSFLIFILGLICLFICLLGIYSSMMIEVKKRTKEMSIRKINGAKIRDIASIFVYKYLYLLLLSAAIAFPIIFIGVTRWLTTYINRVAITPLPFTVLFVMMCAVVLLTIIMQLIKIARVNPSVNIKQD